MTECRLNSRGTVQRPRPSLHPFYRHPGTQVYHRPGADESIMQRALRLRNIDAFEKFKGLLPEFTATINAFEDRPTLIEEFVDILSANQFVLVCLC